jgi:hypothetical protein
MNPPLMGELVVPSLFASPERLPSFGAFRWIALPTAGAFNLLVM